MSRRPSYGSTTLPRGFRFHSNEDNRPQTPEPSPATELQPPSPPRPTRLKVRRRNAPSCQTPTEQFLASVAAADVQFPQSKNHKHLLSHQKIPRWWTAIQSQLIPPGILHLNHAI